MRFQNKQKYTKIVTFKMRFQNKQKYTKIVTFKTRLQSSFKTNKNTQKCAYKNHTESSKNYTVARNQYGITIQYGIF